MILQTKTNYTLDISIIVPSNLLKFVSFSFTKGNREKSFFQGIGCHSVIVTKCHKGRGSTKESHYIFAYNYLLSAFFEELFQFQSNTFWNESQIQLN
jgi:hypothetical protein